MGMEQTETIGNEYAEHAGQALPSISIIVPVYCAQETLSRCVDSVLKQDFEDFELILVDDGSTDGSAALCDAYQAQDKRVRVFHKENTGVSDSRNLGIRMARGRYIQFLDSDDWLAPEACRLLFTAAAEHACDLVIADFYRVVEERIARKGAIKQEGLLSRDEFSTYLMERPSDFYYGVLWNKLFRRDLIEQYRIYLDEDISWCEDIIFNLEYFIHMENVYVLRVPVYYYVKSKDSLSNHAITLSRVIQTKTLVSEYYKEFCTQTVKNGKSDKTAMYRFYLSGAMDGKLPVHASRLGEERVTLSADLAESSGAFSVQYLYGKFLEHCMQIVAYQTDLTTEELSVLLCIAQYPSLKSRREIRALTRLSKRKIKRILQKFRMMSYIDWTDAPKTEPSKDKLDFAHIFILPEAAAVLDKLKSVEQRQREICFSGFTEEERERFEADVEKIRRNIIRALADEKT